MPRKAVFCQLMGGSRFIRTGSECIAALNTSESVNCEGFRTIVSSCQGTEKEYYIPITGSSPQPKHRTRMNNQYIGKNRRMHTNEESEGINMTNKKSDEKQVRQKQMTINGYKVTLSFSEEYNPNLSALVRSTLLDAYIRKNGLCPEEQPA